jgi:hypothetical protein
MKKTITEYSFRDAFHNAGRGDQFSYGALGAIFEYMEEYEQDSGEELELDVIAICCEIEESDADTIISSYSIDVEGMDDDEKLEAVRDYLDENTTVISENDTTFVFVKF